MNIDNMKDLIKDAVDYMEKEIAGYLSKFMKQQDVDDLQLMAVRDAFIRDLIKRLVGGSHYIMTLEWGKENADKDSIDFLKRLIEEVKEAECKKERE